MSESLALMIMMDLVRKEDLALSLVCVRTLRDMPQREHYRNTKL